MSSHVRPEDLLGHILDEIDVLQEIGETVEKDTFLVHAIYQRAAVRSLEIIGEATKKLDDAFRVRYPDVPWRDMARTRDRLIHGYEGVNYRIVWDIIDSEIPKLAAQIREILDSL